MKKIIGIILIMLLMLLSVSFAMDTTKITQENLDAFLKVFPKYTELIRQYQFTEDVVNVNRLPQDVLLKTSVLLKNHGFTLAEFSKLSAKIAGAYGQAEMRDKGYGEMIAMMPQESKMSPEENKIIDNNLDEIRKVMSQEGMI